MQHNKQRQSNIKHTSLLKLRPYARYIARKIGYELVGEGSDWRYLLGAKLYPRRLPDSFNVGAQDPYYVPLQVDLNLVTSRVGFSYAEDGWHPFVQTLKEYCQDSKLRYEDSTLAQLYSNYCPTNVQEALLDHIQEPVMPFHRWPASYEMVSWVWALNKYSVQTYLRRLQSNSKANGWIFFGPHTNEYGRKEFQRLIYIYESIRNNGYKSSLSDVDPINGYFLKDGDKIRFVLLQGNHRVSALKASGYSHIDVLIRQGHPALIDKINLHKWSEAGGGIYPDNAVGALFYSLFNESGLQKAQRLGLTK